MTKYIAAALLTLAPLAAAAFPAVGDMVGTNPEEATKALEAAGCMSPMFEAEDGKIEAKCRDAENKKWEIYIDPTSGKVAKVKADD